MSFDTILERTLAAEAAGFDSVWLMDHLAAPAAPEWDTLEGWTMAGGRPHAPAPHPRPPRRPGVGPARGRDAGGRPRSAQEPHPPRAPRDVRPVPPPGRA